MARTACAPQGATLRLKLDLTQVHSGNPCDTLDVTKTKYTITLPTLTVNVNANTSVQAGETITQANTGAVGTVVATTSTSTSMILENVIGTFTTGSSNTLTGSTSGALSKYPTSLTGSQTGATSADISGKALTGQLTVNPSNANQLYVDIAFAEIAATQGNKDFTAVLQAFDGCESETYNCTIWDRWVTPKVTTLTPSAASVNEGCPVVFTVVSTNVNTGDTMPYTITGVSSADLDGASLTGNFVFGTEQCSNTLTSTASFNISADTSAEGETMTMTIDGTSVSSAVSIVDNGTPCGTMSLVGTNVTEGGTITWTWTANGFTVVDGTVLNYEITGSAVSDNTIVAPNLTGSFTVNNETGTFTTPTVGNTLDDGDRQAIATITTGGIFNQTASVTVADDDPVAPSCVTNNVSVPISWTPCYDSVTGNLRSLTANKYGTFPSGSTAVATAVSVTTGASASISVSSTTGIDVTANQGGIPVKLFTAFNNCSANGPVTGTVVDGTASYINFD